ncbi:MAG: aldehyde dehydrogenase family protein [Betaproteobacteria bacterium]|nr:aldehyde dehydrogenase family protein [Betaproteobacteria bacterium]
MEFVADGPMAIPMWVNGHAFLTVTPEFFTVTNPLTGESLRRVPLCGASEATEAVQAAQAAQSAWAMMGMPARRVCLGRLADALDRYTGHFAKLLAQECGFDEARATAEVSEAVDALRGAMVGETGVFGVVLDASRPLAGFAEIIAPALMAGATLVVKPSPKAPSAVFALCELTSREDWPAGVVNLLQGDAAAIEGLCASGIDRLVYCGNPVLGKKIGAMAEAAGKNFELKAI